MSLWDEIVCKCLCGLTMVWFKSESFFSNVHFGWPIEGWECGTEISVIVSALV